MSLRAERNALKELLRNHVPTCTAINAEDEFCGKFADFQVEWSDRKMSICADHLDYAKKAAANDGESDRTDNPYITDIAKVFEGERAALTQSHRPRGDR